MSSEARDGQSESIAKIVGLATVSAWFALCGMSKTTYAGLSTDFFSIVSFACVSILVAIFHQGALSILQRHNRVVLLIPLLGSVALLLTEVFGLESTIAGFLTALFSGAGVSALVVLWGTSFVGQQLSINKLTSQIILVYLLVTCLYLPFIAAPDYGAAIYRSTLPLVSSIILLFYSKRKSFIFEAAQSSELTQKDGKKIDAHENKGHPKEIKELVFRLLIALNMISLVPDVMHSLNAYYIYEVGHGSLVDFLLPVVIAKMVCLIVAYALFSSFRKMRLVYVYRVIVLGIVIAFLLLPITGLESTIPYGVSSLALILLSIFLWVVSLRIVDVYKVPPLVMIGLPQGCFLGLQIVLGILFAQFVFPFESQAPVVLSLLAFGGTLITIITYLLIFNEKTLYRAFQEERDFINEITDSINETPIDQDNTTHQLYDDKEKNWDILSERYSLTKREREVLTLFSHGRSYKRIQETLYLSRGTVNFHMTNGYQKLGVSNRQEVLDLLENCGKEES